MKSLIPRREKKELAPTAGYEADPFGELHREMTRLFDGFLDSFGHLERRLGRGFDPAAIAPRFEVSETDDSVLVKAELPGMDQKDIEVTLDEDALTVRGEKREEKEEKRRNYHLSELSYGQFHRVIPLPPGIDRDKAKATFKNGVLHLTMPKTPESRSRSKPVKITAE
jgi:HSP20 family protein